MVLFLRSQLVGTISLKLHTAKYIYNRISNTLKTCGFLLEVVVSSNIKIRMIFNHNFSWKYLIFSTVVLFLYACGSSSSQEDDKNTVAPDPSPTAFTLNPIAQGKVVDGYISGATVFIDQNFNLSQDEGEIWTISSESGEFLLDGVIDKLLELELIQAADTGGSTDILLKIILRVMP